MRSKEVRGLMILASSSDVFFQSNRSWCGSQGGGRRFESGRSYHEFSQAIGRFRWPDLFFRAQIGTPMAQCPSASSPINAFCNPRLLIVWRWLWIFLGPSLCAFFAGERHSRLPFRERRFYLVTRHAGVHRARVRVASGERHVQRLELPDARP